MRIVLSPVGTSILTNQAEEHRSTLSKYANAQQKEVPQDIVNLVEKIQKEALEKLASAGISEWQKKSAELNGIIRAC